MDRVILLAVLALAAGTCAAEDARWYLKVDNDVVFGTDRWYTSGVRLARVQDDLEFALVQEIYTPDAKNWHFGVDDRAPVGRLLAIGAMHGRGADHLQTFEVAAGMRGPSAHGRESTDTIHQVIPAPEVDWSRQLDDRFDGHVAFTRSQSVFFDALKLHGGGTLGTQVSFAHAGFELRAGDKSMASSLLRFISTPPFGSAPGWSAYAGASIRAVGRNELISKNYDPFGPELDYRRSVSRVAAGVAWTAGWGMVAFDLAQDSREFEAQSHPMRFGSLTIHVAF